MKQNYSHVNVNKEQKGLVWLTFPEKGLIWLTFPKLLLCYFPNC